MKTKKLLMILFVVSVFLGIVFLILNQLGFLTLITQTTSWVDEESYATWSGVWDTNNPVTNAYDENWGTTTSLSGTYKEANIYEYSVLDYPQDALLDYIEFQVSYLVAHVPITDGYASIKYYAWNYQTSSWDKVYEDLEDGLEYGGRPLTRTFQVSAIDHLQNNQVRLRTHATIGRLSTVFVYESMVRASYSLDVDCDLGETKCDGANNREYFTCENYEWVNQGPTIGQCNAECLVNSNCLAGGYTGEKYCLNDSVAQKYVSYPCIEYQCAYSLVEKTIITCEFGCENGQCNITPPPEIKPTIGEWFANIWNSIINWFKGIFG